MGKFYILTPTSPPHLSGTLAHRPLPPFRLPVSRLVPIKRSPPASYELLQRSRPPPPTSRLRTSPPIVAIADLPQLELAAAGARPEGLLGQQRCFVGGGGGPRHRRTSRVVRGGDLVSDPNRGRERA